MHRVGYSVKRMSAQKTKSAKYGMKLWHAVETDLKSTKQRERDRKYPKLLFHKARQHTSKNGMIQWCNFVIHRFTVSSGEFSLVKLPRMRTTIVIRRGWT